MVPDSSHAGPNSFDMSACCLVFFQVKDDEIYLVVNAGCRDKDLAHLGKHLEAAKVSAGLGFDFRVHASTR